MLFNIWLAGWVTTNFFNGITIQKCISACEFLHAEKMPIKYKFSFFAVVFIANFLIWPLGMLIAIRPKSEKEFIQGFIESYINHHKNNS